MRLRIFLLSILVLTACGVQPTSSSVSMRPLTKAEAHEDLNELVSKIKALYGPLKFKEARFGYKFEDLATAAHAEIDAAKSDEEMLGVFAKLLAKLEDAHVGITFPANSSGVATYNIDIFVIPVEGRAIVASVGAALKDSGIDIGDELTSVDGEKPFDLLQTVLKYRRIANPISDQQLLYRILSRPSYMTELTPRSGTAHLVFAKANGAKFERDLTWHTAATLATANTLVASPRTNPLKHELKIDFANDYNRVAGMNKMGSVTPFFLTDQVTQTFHPVRVTANGDFLKQYGLDPAKSPEIYAAMYRYEGKTLLLLRQPTYSHQAPETFSNDDYMKAYRAVMAQYEGVVDGLVLDQTHNGGGSYCEEFFTLFISGQKNAAVQKMNADRKWIVDLHGWAREVDPTLQSELARTLLNMANVIEKAYDAGKNLSEPVALFGGSTLVSADATYTWKKPMLVLVDELSASCADAFPLLVKNNNVAKIFGERTMGAGGNVEPVLEMSHSRAVVRMTRGLFTSFKANNVYIESDFVENNGVQPDYHYGHTVDDVRAGYVKYFEEFSKKAVEQIH